MGSWLKDLRADNWEKFWLQEVYVWQVAWFLLIGYGIYVSWLTINGGLVIAMLITLINLCVIIWRGTRPREIK